METSQEGQPHDQCVGLWAHLAFGEQRETGDWAVSCGQWFSQSCLRSETPMKSLDLEARGASRWVNPLTYREGDAPVPVGAGLEAGHDSPTPLSLCLFLFGCSWVVYFIVNYNHKYSMSLDSVSDSSDLSKLRGRGQPWVCNGRGRRAGAPRPGMGSEGGLTEVWAWVWCWRQCRVGVLNWGTVLGRKWNVSDRENLTMTMWLQIEKKSHKITIKMCKVPHSISKGI